MDKDKFKKLMLGLMLGIIALIIIIIVISTLMNSRVSPDKAEERLVNAAMKYIEKNPKEAPKVGESKILSHTELVNKKYIKPLDKFISKKYSCTGNVHVENDGKNYQFFGELDCGTSYKKDYFVNALKTNLVTLNTDEGLHKVNDEYIFKGENPKNYVLLNDVVWRIIKITDEDKIQMVVDRRLTLDSVWDNRFNKELDSYAGIKNFELSRIKEAAENYLETVYAKKNSVVKYFTTNDVCVDEIHESSQVTNSCKKILENQKISIVGVYDFMNASLDVNCKTTTDNSCGNYNYLNTGISFFTKDVSDGSNNLVYAISIGEITKRPANNRFSVRPVIYLNNKTPAPTVGNGSEKNPYVIE